MYPSVSRPIASCCLLQQQINKCYDWLSLAPLTSALRWHNAPIEEVVTKQWLWRLITINLNRNDGKQLQPRPFTWHLLESVILRYFLVRRGKTGKGLILRLSGAPNGFAAITTAASGIEQMAIMEWYDSFYDAIRNSDDQNRQVNPYLATDLTVFKGFEKSPT